MRTTLSTILLAVFIALLPNKGMGAFVFETSSPLESGNWIKIEVPESGIYQISYDQLRSMGFANPEKVGVFGKGGSSIPMSFTTSTGKPNFKDGIPNVPVLHYNNNLYFYAKGVETVSFNPVSDMFPTFINEDVNIYTVNATYFLSDIMKNPVTMTSFEIPDEEDLPVIEAGYDYIRHEEDLVQNCTGTGQLFWGENLLEKPYFYEWNHHLQYADLSQPIIMKCNLFAAKRASGKVGYGIRGCNDSKLFDIVSYSSAAFRAQGENTAILSPKSPDVTVYVESQNVNGSFLNLDNWILTYRKHIPDFSLSDDNQHRLTVLNNSRFAAVPVPAGKKVFVIDYTDPSDPSIAPIREEDNKQVAVINRSSGNDFNNLILFDAEKNQKNILNWKKVNNTNLREKALEGADLLIITVPYLRQYADEIAELHRSLDGIKVTVAETEDIYNEFSGGMPDPMAYRSIIKMLYESKYGLKNALLLGPNYSDFRWAINEGRPEGIIGFQENVVTADRMAAHATDFFGLTSDYIHVNSIQEDKMTVGIGLLPVTNDQEASFVVEKIRNYVNRTDFAEYINEFLSVSGFGDNHTHDIQAVDVCSYLETVMPSQWINAVLAMDAYGENAAKRKFFNDLDRGKLITYYHGHGAAYRVPGTSSFITAGDVLNMKNPFTGFIYFAGCDLSVPDRRMPGISEYIVTGTPHGAAACLFASRTTWSGQNYDLTRRLSNAFFNKPDNQGPRTETPTIGEVIADAKTSGKYANELCYLLVGDPAIKIPVPIFSVNADSDLKLVKPGDKITLTGNILNADGDKVTDFSGDLVVKIMAPPFTEEPDNFITGAPYDNPTGSRKLLITYPDIRLEQFRGTVTNGEFTMEIPVPAEAENYEGQNLALYISAYSLYGKRGAAGIMNIPVAFSQNESESVNTDSQPPVISASFDPIMKVVRVTVEDNYSIPANSLVSADADGAHLNIVCDKTSGTTNTRTYSVFPPSRGEGEYSIHLKAADRAGLVREVDFDFTILPPVAPIILSSESKAYVDMACFELIVNPEAAYSSIPSDSMVEIEDEKGKVVAVLNVSGEAAIWDLCDTAGNRCSKGLYRARALNSRDPYMYSDWTSFAIIE